MRSTRKATQSVLVVAAHPDDEVLGCGGTLARMASEGHDVHLLLLADGETARPRVKPSSKLAIRNAAADAAREIMGCSSVEVLGLPDNRLDSLDLLDVVKPIEAAVLRYAPGVVFTHHAGDVNIDHRIAHDAVLAACRPQPHHPVRQLLFFEVASSTEWRPPASSLSFVPNWFVDISATLDKKLAALQAYDSELREFPHPRSLKGIEALARWRGATIGVDAAESFILGRNIVR